MPTIDMQNSDERYLLITAVTPEPDKSNPILQNPDVLPGKLTRELVQCVHPSLMPRPLYSYSELFREQRDSSILLHTAFG